VYLPLSLHCDQAITLIEEERSFPIAGSWPGLLNVSFKTSKASVEAREYHEHNFMFFGMHSAATYTPPSFSFCLSNPLEKMK
jgi:hypothetical protein